MGAVLLIWRIAIALLSYPFPRIMIFCRRAERKMVYFLGCLCSSFWANHLLLSGLYQHRIGCRSATVFSPFCMSVSCSLSVVFLWQTGQSCLKFSDIANSLLFFTAFTACFPVFMNLPAQSDFLCKPSASLLSLSQDV